MIDNDKILSWCKINIKMDCVICDPLIVFSGENFDKIISPYFIFSGENVMLMKWKSVGND